LSPVAYLLRRHIGCVRRLRRAMMMVSMLSSVELRRLFDTRRLGRR
jgi:hypothetical protein